MLDLRRLSLILVVSAAFVSFGPGDALASWPDFWLSSDCFSAAAQGNQSTAALAFDGTNFLVVWEDERIESERDIFATRVSKEGEILDPAAIPICTSPGTQSFASVAWGGENYLVVWQDFREVEWAIYGARVDLEGNVLDPEGFYIAGGWDWTRYPAVASDGANFLVVWSYIDLETLDDIYGARVTPEGEVLDPGGILISAAAAPEYYASVAYNGSTYLVVWQKEGG
jgi:hypothetical protein